MLTQEVIEAPRQPLHCHSQRLNYF